MATVSEGVDQIRSVGSTRRILQTAGKAWQFRFGVALLGLLIAAAFIYPQLSSLSATQINVMDRFKPPIFLSGGTWQHVLGTDQLGRDVLLRTLVGLRNAMGIGVAAVVIMFSVGVLAGLISGYFGRWVDTILMRLTDAQLSVPFIILAIVILTVQRPNAVSVILCLALSGWPVYARVARSVTLTERSREYVRGAKILGASNMAIIFRLIAPNVLPPIAFVAVLDVARMMIFGAILGYIGIGIQPPTPTFGTMIADGQKYLINAWWIATLPGVFLFACLLSINLIGTSIEHARSKVFGGLV